MGIKENIKKILSEIPDYVTVVAAAKTRTPEEILEAIEAGIEIIGENYVQEAQKAFEAVGKKAQWHMIGHLQKNKVKKAVQIFDMIQTVDSVKIANEINKRAAQFGKVMPVLIEVNSGREEQKAGVLPEDVFRLVEEISKLENIRIEGLMTMGPVVDAPEELRPYFSLTRELFENLSREKLPGVEMKWLSMGMSDSYKIAIKEGANMIRLGTILFGPRK
ncbi:MULTISPECIES: YggS family pyridoxal phosphate-dependent enzyme [Kosmotoga]|uniref:Pyridoxal phosphate homeostasis protein n=1 Tax=Kosmotoga olearia (strain ATCC BAA-1733 / DSM 21960 / TBF 19.5.1) TaxID=521045 RepID=C5CG86_KOSOT|nr:MULTISPECIES: YggS family pyridoxal phosphate-dependent enzyme [Kosmotoga]ACR79527.1 alanine racemase domain protein [Kosmotoga olearia TBF 19.5.1]OAA22087.1 alanine racemase [Kosmotoga sp. DU53]